MDKALKKFIRMHRNEVLTILEKYSEWLEEQGYTDNDWRAEPPFAIDEFMKQLHHGSNSK